MSIYEDRETLRRERPASCTCDWDIILPGTAYEHLVFNNELRKECPIHYPYPRFRVQDNMWYTVRLVEKRKPDYHWFHGPDGGAVQASPIYILEVDGLTQVYFTKSHSFEAQISEKPQRMRRLYNNKLKRHEWELEV